MISYTPMANGRYQTVMNVGKFYGSYVATTNDRIGTFASTDSDLVRRARALAKQARQG